MNIENALESAASGDSLLFLGAGFSLGATNANGSSFKTGRDLAKYLSQLTSLPEDTALQDVADVYLDKFGADELIKLLKREFVAKQVTESQRNLAALPWMRMYTTNYDNVFELAATGVNRVVAPVDPETDIYHASKSDTLCVHLNGFINSLNRDNIRKSFRLTDTSYASSAIAQSPWAALFRRDVRYAQSVFFVGYSLFDLDIKRILYESPQLQQKTFFILHDAADPVTVMRANKYGSVERIGLSGFSAQIVAGGFLEPRKSRSLRIGRSILEYKPPLQARTPTDREFLDLIMMGSFRPELADKTSADRNLYCCERSVVADIVQRIDSRQDRAIAVYSDIANGKTVLLELIAKEAAALGWRVFQTSEVSEYATDELSEIAAISGKTLLLVDNYVDWIKSLRDLMTVASDRFAIVLTARSNSHDLAIEDLEAALYPLAITECDINVISGSDLDWWVQALDTYGLWGELAGKSREAKTRYLTDRCEQRTQSILLELFESPQIAGRLSSAASSIRKDPVAEKIAIACFALTILNQYPTVDTLVDVFGVDSIRSSGATENEGLTQFVDISRYAVKVRSTVVAEFLLNHYWNADTVVQVVLDIAKAADRLYHTSIKHENLFKALMRFSSVQQVLPEKGKREAVVAYYESLKVLKRCERYPLFWLQYAIGAIVTGDLTRAKRYFDTAYSLAEEWNWDTFQIDNHYARYLLIYAAEDAPFEETMALFREARTLINRQIRSDKLHYPYRVASTYQRVFDRFQSKFSDEALKEIAEAARTVYERIKELPNHVATNRHVVLCENSMRYIMDSVSRRLSTK